jgi:hypothetical protein
MKARAHVAHLYNGLARFDAAAQRVQAVLPCGWMGRLVYGCNLPLHRRQLRMHTLFQLV